MLIESMPTRTGGIEVLLYRAARTAEYHALGLRCLVDGGAESQCYRRHAEVPKL